MFQPADKCGTLPCWSGAFATPVAYEPAFPTSIHSRSQRRRNQIANCPVFGRVPVLRLVFDFFQRSFPTVNPPPTQTRTDTRPNLHAIPHTLFALSHGTSGSWAIDPRGQFCQVLTLPVTVRTQSESLALALPAHALDQ
jgi:hypothetical protein